MPNDEIILKLNVEIALVLNVNKTLTPSRRTGFRGRKAQEEGVEEDTHDREMPKRRRVMSRDTYDSLLRLSDDGCPLVLDLEEYEVVEKGSSLTDERLGR